MNLTFSQKRIIERVVNAFETGSADGNYAAIAIFHDGPHDIRQTTYGRSQKTEYGNPRELLASHPRPVIQKTACRTACFRAEINRGNWDLGMLPISANGVKVS